MCAALFKFPVKNKRKRQRVDNAPGPKGRDELQVFTSNKGQRQDREFWSGLVWAMETSGDSVEEFKRRIEQVEHRVNNVDPPRHPKLELVRDNTPPKW